jgi:hypothetical protein
VSMSLPSPQFSSPLGSTETLQRNNFHGVLDTLGGGVEDMN